MAHDSSSRSRSAKQREKLPIGIRATAGAMSRYPNEANPNGVGGLPTGEGQSIRDEAADPLLEES